MPACSPTWPTLRPSATRSQASDGRDHPQSTGGDGDQVAGQGGDVGAVGGEGAALLEQRAAVADVLGQVTPQGRPGPVVHDGPGREAQRVAGQLGPPAQAHVVAAPSGGPEAAQLDEHLTGDAQVGGGGEGQEADEAGQVGGALGSRPPGLHGRVVEQVEVDGAAHQGVVAEALQQPVDPLGADHVVGVAEQQLTASGRRHAQVAGLVGAASPGGHHADAAVDGGPAGGDLRAGVVGAVVDHQDLEGGVGALAVQRPELLVERGGGVVHGQDHRGGHLAAAVGRASPPDGVRCSPRGVRRRFRLRLRRRLRPRFRLRLRRRLRPRFRLRPRRRSGERSRRSGRSGRFRRFRGRLPLAGRGHRIPGMDGRATGRCGPGPPAPAPARAATPAPSRGRIGRRRADKRQPGDTRRSGGRRSGDVPTSVAAPAPGTAHSSHGDAPSTVLAASSRSSRRSGTGPASGGARLRRPA